MGSLVADHFYREGLAALRREAPREAMVAFARALEIENRLARPGWRTLSYFGLSMARSGMSRHLAFDACRLAAAMARRDPLPYLNLGRVYAEAGQRVPAIEAFASGLRLRPESASLRRELARIDRRARPVFGSLVREHPLNRWCGRLRTRLSPRPAA